MRFHPKPFTSCRICGDPTPHVHAGSDDPIGEAVPVAIRDARTTPRFVIVDLGLERVEVDASEVDDVLERAFGGR